VSFPDESAAVPLSKGQLKKLAKAQAAKEKKAAKKVEGAPASKKEEVKKGTPASTAPAT